MPVTSLFSLFRARGWGRQSEQQLDVLYLAGSSSVTAQVTPAPPYGAMVVHLITFNHLLPNAFSVTVHQREVGQHSVFLSADLGSIEVPSYVLKEAPNSFALRVSGNSLASDWIYEGDIVVVDPGAPFVEGKIYAVRSEENHQTIAARKVYTSGRKNYKIVSGDGAVDEVACSSTTLLGRIRWSFREH